MVSIGHHRIGIMRVGGQLHALADRCPHRGAPLCSFGEIVTDIERLPDGTTLLVMPGPAGPDQAPLAEVIPSADMIPAIRKSAA